MADEETADIKFSLRVPQPLWVKLNRRATKNRRSLNSEILVLLERGADEEEGNINDQMNRIFEDLKRMALAPDTPDRAR
ncbi:MAG: Arc family DNA-binding protein [Spirochaetales bacterium]